MEEHYEYLLGFTEKTAAYVRIKIKETLKLIEELKHNNDCYYIRFTERMMLSADVKSIEYAFDQYFKDVKGFSLSIPTGYEEYFDL